LNPDQRQTNLILMNNHRPPELDMNLQGEFVEPPRPPVTTRIMLWAIVVAVLAGALAIAAVALWLAMIVLPVAVGAGVIAYGLYRFQAWRAGASLSGQRNLWRP
jgi:hypothetical protein